MEQSEFTPPARQSLTDEQISQQLGSATADEAGMLAAMDFLEKQTALRDQDNREMAQWISKMEESVDPRAVIALQNVELVKQGLEPLPIPESAPQEVVIETVATNREGFDELLVETLTVEPIVEIENEKPVNGYRLVSAANWILGAGILAPIAGAITANLLGMNFVTSVLAGLVGILVGVKVNVLGLVTATRTHRGLAVATRATYGVFGSILPAIFVILAGFGSLGVLIFGTVKNVDGRIVGLPESSSVLLSFGDLGSITIGSVFAIALALVTGILAIFGGKFSRFLKIGLAGISLASFLTLAIATSPNINFLNLAGFFQLDSFLVGAPIFALVISVFAYGIDGESISIASWGASKKRLAWPIYIFGAILPLLVYAHIAALLNNKTFENVSEVLDYLLQIGGPIFGSAMLDVAIVLVIGLLYGGLMKLIEALKALGTNHVGYGSAILMNSLFISVIAVEAIFLIEPLTTNFLLTAILLVPSAAWMGALLTETVMRRGKFHDASLTRGYGFYGAFNWLSTIVFLASSAAGFAFVQPEGFATWFGFLSPSTGLEVSATLGALIAMGAAVVLTLICAYPSIRRQQIETKTVDERRFDLVDVVVD